MKRLLSGILTLMTTASTTGAAERKPNIVIIMADDHCRQATRCYNPESLIQTPQIDRLAKTGVLFEHAMVGNSYCCPSRATMLTGKYNHLCGTRRLNEAFDGSQQTFPKLLQAAGYQTALVGKWHLSSEPTGFDYYSVHPGQGQYTNCPMKEIGKPWGNGNSGGVPHQGYLTDVITDLSLQWLEHRDPGKPFCLMIHHKAPHEPHHPAPRHKDLFKDTVFPEPPTLLDDYKGRAPEAVPALSSSRLVENRFAQYKSVRDQFTGDRAHDTRLIYQEYMKGYLRLVATLDENVGRVLDHLDKTGLATNTVVIYTSDNGYFNGEHGFYNKMWMYEESLHIPLIIRAPGAPAGKTNAELVAMIDLAPTVLDFAGVKVPDDMQGVSMKPLVLGQEVKWREAFYYRFYGVAGAGNPSDWLNRTQGIIGLRTKTAKLICYPAWPAEPFWEYFDLIQDPREMDNLYRDPKRQEEIAAAKKQLRDLAQRYQDTEAIKKLEIPKQ